MPHQAPVSAGTAWARPGPSARQLHGPGPAPRCPEPDAPLQTGVALCVVAWALSDGRGGYGCCLLPTPVAPGSRVSSVADCAQRFSGSNEFDFWVGPQFGRLILKSIFTCISSYGRESELGSISIKNIGLILKMKTNKTALLEKTTTQTALARPGCKLWHSGSLQVPAVLPARALPRGTSSRDAGCPVGTTDALLQTLAGSGVSSASDVGSTRELQTLRTVVG